MNRRKIASAVAAVALAVGGLGALAATAATAGPAGQTYTPVTPVRICDTRGGTQVAGGCSTGQVKAGGSVTVSPDAAGISGESAVVLNVTATGSSGGGNITVDPAGTVETKTSNLNYSAGQTIPNLVIVPVGTGDGVTLFNNSGAGVQIIVDLEGYYTGPSPAPTTPAPTTASASAYPTTTTTPGGPFGVPGSWTLDRADEFNGTSVDRGLWAGWFNATGGKPVNSGEDQGYSGANVTEPGDGYLHLTLSSTTGALVSSNPHDGVSGHTGYEFTGTAAAEARIFLPGTGSTVDNWPAFWTDGQSWPANGESDVMEGLGGQTACHSHTSSNQNASGNCPNVGPGWHTFGEMWDAAAQTVTYYYDGTQVGSAPFANGDAPNYLILDNTSSASSGGPTVRNQDMLVDYVRVWKPAS